MKSSYSDAQLNMLRKALIDYRNTGKEERGKAYSWNDVSNAIKDKIGVEISHKNLSKFAQGIPARSNSSKSEREYPKKLADDGLDHILTFFTDDIDGELVQINKREFELEKTETKWPEHLQSYFNEGYSELEGIEIKSLSGSYRSLVESEWYELNINFDSVKKLMAFSLYSNDDEYKGWLVSSKQDQILFIGRDTHDFDNHIVYTVVGFNNQLRRESTKATLAMMKYSFPEDRFDTTSEYRDFMKAISEEISSSLHVYTEKITVDFTEEY